MSMIGYFLLASDEVLRALLAEPVAIHDFLHSSLEEESYDLLNIEKSWHILHYLLTGTAWGGEPPLNFIVAGGETVGEEDIGYGPARAFTSAEVRAIADALDRIDRRRLLDRFDGKEMDELGIYPPINWQDVAPPSLDDPRKRDEVVRMYQVILNDDCNCKCLPVEKAECKDGLCIGILVP
jgi:hypothetical protein